MKHFKVKLKDFLERHGLESLKFNARFMQAELKLTDRDADAAWELYVELLTRAMTQPLPEGEGTEQAALASAYSLFGTTREILKRHGRHSKAFTQIAVVVLNQKVRPFTTKWHKRSEEKVFDQAEQRREFRKDLEELRVLLKSYARALAELARVEDLTEMEDAPPAKG